MKYKITKMDNRYSKYGYQYLIEFSQNFRNGTGVLDFDRSRRWFNEHYGWSQDVETRASIIKSAPLDELPEAFNSAWAYSIKYNDYRIYVHDDATLNWFVLSHPKDTRAIY